MKNFGGGAGCKMRLDAKGFAQASWASWRRRGRLHARVLQNGDPNGVHGFSVHAACMCGQAKIGLKGRNDV
jgi:hypothetical protein